jgi:predicted alpha/beta hydrolase family esterase
MLARQLRISLLVQILAGCALAAWLIGASSPARVAAALLLGVLTPAIVSAVALAVEVAVGAVVDPRTPRAGLGRLLQVWLGETRVSVTAFAWRQPFAADFAEPAVRHDPARPAVLLIHGYACNRAVWRPLLSAGPLDDCNVATINLEPPMGSIDAYATLIAGAVDALRARSGAPRVTLVCHSMGGLAARAYLRACGQGAVERVITIATPHLGTIFGNLGFGANARQMTPRSTFVAALDAATTADQRRLFCCLAASDDNLIVPRANALLGGARHLRFDAVGHLAMIEDPRVWRAVAACIHDEHRPAAGHVPAATASP